MEANSVLNLTQYNQAGSSGAERIVHHGRPGRPANNSNHNNSSTTSNNSDQRRAVIAQATSSGQVKHRSNPNAASDLSTMAEELLRASGALLSNQRTVVSAK